MKNDPAIESIRKTRHKISERFGHDTKALIEHYEKMQEKYADRIVAETSAVSIPSGVEHAGHALHRTSLTRRR